ncbi:MAG: DinB family protein [Verrucomicrobiota bacterium]
MLAAAIRANLHVLQQGHDLLNALEPASYVARVPACFNSTPGGHLRHVIDHYLGLLDGLGGGRVDYECRSRDPRIEGETDYAAAIIAGIMDRLGALLEAEDRMIAVRAESAGDAADAADAWGDTSLLRELEFLLSHTVHHYALIAIMCRLLGHEPAADFGMAPSTLKYRESRALAAS